MRHSPPARVYLRAALVGGVAAAVIELALLLSGGHFFGYEPLGDVFDAQARSLLHLHWDIPADVVKIEGFEIHGRTYTYFGPVPALLRIPVVAATAALDGRLTRLSMLLAWLVTVSIAGRLAWRARRWLGRAEAPVERFEQALVALFVFSVGAGSSVTYLTSRPSVFHEAIAWGVATSLVAVEAVLAWVERRSARRFVVMLLLATVALLTRASVGAGPALAIGFVLLADLVQALRAKELRRAVGSVLLGLTLLLPLGTYAAVNEARFGTAFSLPYDRHRVSMVVEHRREVLAANGGTIQGPQFLPTTALQYLRPDAIGFDGSFPWIDFPRRAPVVGDVLMDQIDVASSVPSSMPALALLALLGLVVQVRRKGLRRWWAVTAGTALCLVVTLAIGFVAQRYTADAVPFLVAAGATAVAALPVGPPSKARRRLVLVVVAVLAMASAAITAALTIQFERHYGFLTAPSLRASLAREQLALPHAPRSLGRLRVGDELPPVARDRTFAVVGDCDGLYRSDGTSWQPVEGTPATGHYRVRIRRGVGPVPLIAGITVTWHGDDVVVARGGAPTRPVTGAGRDVVLDVVADRLLGFVDVRHDGELVLSDYFLDPKEGEVLVDGGRVEVLSTPTPVCDELVGRSS